jgi:mannosyltransferase
MSPAAVSPAGSSPLQRGKPLRSGGSVRPDRPLLPRATGPAAGPPAAGPPAGQPPAAQRSGFAAGPLWMRAIPPAATLAVMLWGIRGSSYWRDEAATLAAVRRPFGDLVSMLGNVDAVHGAYYMIIWVVVRLGGTGEFVTRLPSALAMAAAAAGAAAIGRRLVSPRAGLFAGLLFAALPKVSWFGQDARSYAMVTALATAASYLLVRLLNAGDPRRRWLAAYAASLAGLGVANVFALLIVPAHGLTMLLAARHARRRPGTTAVPPLASWAAAAGLAVTAVSPLAVLAYHERRQIGWIQDAHTGGLASVRQLVGPLAVFELMVLIMACAIMLGALHGPGGISAGLPPRLQAVCLPWLLLPPAALLSWSLIQPVYTFRYILFCVPAVALLGGAALAATGRAAGTVALVLVVLAGLPAQLTERDPDGHGDNIRGIDLVIARHARPGDGVYYLDDGARAFEAAYPYGLPMLRDIALGQTPVKMAKLIGTNLHGAPLHEVFTDVRRLWVVQVSHLAPAPMLRDLRFRLARRWHVSDLWLQLYVRHPAVRDPDGHGRA